MQQDICLGVYRYGYVFVYMRLSVGLCVFFCIYVPVFAYAFYDFNVFYDFRAFYLSAQVQFFLFVACRKPERYFLYTGTSKYIVYASSIP